MSQVAKTRVSEGIDRPDDRKDYETRLGINHF